MNFGKPSPRPTHCGSCTCGEVGPLGVAAIRARAKEYADGLNPGAQIHPYDETYLGPARDFLPEFLTQRGLLLRPRNEGGTLVYTVVQEGNS